MIIVYWEQIQTFVADVAKKHPVKIALQFLLEPLLNPAHLPELLDILPFLAPLTILQGHYVL